MRIHSTLMRATVCVFAFLASLSAHGQRRWDAPSIVTTNCSGCHGIDGSAELSYFPRLANLDAAYADTKMAEFKENPSPSSLELYVWMRSVFNKKRSHADPTRNGLINMVGIAHTAKPFESLGYAQALAVIEGRLTREEAIAATQQATRRYAKRQMTWFRREREIRWFSGFGEDSAIQDQAYADVRELL